MRVGVKSGDILCQIFGCLPMSNCLARRLAPIVGGKKEPNPAARIPSPRPSRGEG